MFDFLKRKQEPEPDHTATPHDNTTTSSTRQGLFARLKQGLTKTRSNFASGIANLFLGKKELGPDLLDEIEMRLLSADVGTETTQRLIKLLTEKLRRNELSDGAIALQYLQTEMKNILRPCAIPLDVTVAKPMTILMVGINGSGKTTTIGKLAYLLQQQGKSVLMAAGDTFRAAAIEQLQVWGERNKISVIAQQAGADTAAVIYDALAAAKSRHIDILLADTAGRLHTQHNLMAELAKIKRVLAKLDPTAPQEILIVLDATLGQNALNQVKQFQQAIGVTGIVLTKLDGTAKGGVIFAIAEQTKIPIRYIGIGEGIDDLRPFVVDDFVDALFD